MWRRSPAPFPAGGSLRLLLEAIRSRDTSLVPGHSRARAGAGSLSCQLRVYPIGTAHSPLPAAILATWPMRGAARACYTRWRERGPRAAVDAMNRSLRKATTPPGPHVVTDLPLACAARQHLAMARGL